ncbi:hypothetical protein BKA82DRAFT_1005653 [Pisolithus tinctorius]|uniref:C2H2-type domain-containing protein n=1 Tax=Pisolithus tinctorius Marx 270 TaxID=870435 RepID=A0A0C3IME2_PISTI|nr:hypothetical protein BKA82DRAFT_1005653 [Pisolithus tinctorius]KIN98127.1 hypothetical protein M404DRAFT_1005653 [Pisolithus tinctorius Marx 270]
MSHCQSGSGFNENWSPEDEYTMLNYLSGPRAQQPHTCGWVVGGEPCNDVLFPEQFSGHLRAHGISGGDTTTVSCRWVACDAPQMKRENMLRHVFEVHLELRFECTDCGLSFTRKNSLNNHRKRTHP